jgi:hypothetical protein
MRASLKRAEKPPSSIIQALPLDEVKALKVLFFMHMPPEFRLLSALSFAAQQMLLPRTPDIFEIMDGM